jgi:hypothetical protein
VLSLPRSCTGNVYYRVILRRSSPNQGERYFDIGLGCTINRSHSNQILSYSRFHRLISCAQVRAILAMNTIKGVGDDLVHQDPPNDVIAAPSHLVPVVGRASTIRFGTTGTRLDLACLFLPSAAQVVASQTLSCIDLPPAATDSRLRTLDRRSTCRSVLRTVLSLPRPTQGTFIIGCSASKFP